MAAQTIHPKWLQSIKAVFGGNAPSPDRCECSQRVLIHETDAYTVPEDTRKLRVACGGAWVSHLREDIILYTGQVLHLRPYDQNSVVVTALGHEPLELEIYR